MRTPEEQLEVWKSKCLAAEKALKAADDLANQRTLELMEIRAHLSMWRNRAESAEAQLREFNE